MKKRILLTRIDGDKFSIPTKGIHVRPEKQGAFVALLKPLEEANHFVHGFRVKETVEEIHNMIGEE